MKNDSPHRKSYLNLDLLNPFLLAIFFVSLYIVVFQGFGFPSISYFWNIALRIFAALAIQLFFLRTRLPIILRLLPLLATGGFALWALWLYLTVWTQTSFLSLTGEFLSPAITCALTLFLFRIFQRRGRYA